MCGHASHSFHGCSQPAHCQPLLVSVPQFRYNHVRLGVQRLQLGCPPEAEVQQCGTSGSSHLCFARAQLGHDLLNGSGSAAASAASAPAPPHATANDSRSPACMLAEALLAEAGGRLWDGKEAVLDALAALAKSAPGEGGQGTR